MKKILPLVCLCLSIVCFAEGQKNELRLADSLQECGKLFEASVWYEHCLFAEADPQLCVLAVKGKINCLKAQHKFTETLDFINRSRALDIPDSFRQHLAYDEVIVSYLSGHFVNAIEDAKNLDTLSFSDEEIKIAKLISILSLNELCRWDEAENVYIEYLDRYFGTAATLLQRGLYADKPTLKSLDKAKFLSNLFPGLGQVYTGKPWEGVTNLLLQVGSLWFSVIAWQEGYPIASLLVGGSSFSAFRSGGKRRASNLVKQYNKISIDKYNDYLRKQLLSPYTLKTL